MVKCDLNEFQASFEIELDVVDLEKYALANAKVSRS